MGELRSLTHGRGNFERTPHGYDEVPEHLARGLIDSYKKARAEGTT